MITNLRMELFEALVCTFSSLMMTCLQALAILSRNHSAQLMSSIGDAIKAQAAHVRMMNKKKNISDYDELMASHCQV